MDSLKLLQEKSSQTIFDKKVLSIIQYLHPYVKHRIYVAEATRILPKNMYSSNGIIDDSIVKLYKNKFTPDAETSTIKLHLFEIVDEHLKQLFKRESFHKNTISTDSILKEELHNLEERYTVNADMEYIMSEDLDDISYKQDDGYTHLFLYADKEVSILKAFDLENKPSKHTQNLFSKFYSWLPLTTSNIIDLYVFGNLNYEEIAKVEHLEVTDVEQILNTVKKQFRQNLD